MGVYVCFISHHSLFEKYIYSKFYCFWFKVKWKRKHMKIMYFTIH